MRDLQPQTLASEIQDDAPKGITFLDAPVSGVPMARAVVAAPSDANAAPALNPSLSPAPETTYEPTLPADFETHLASLDTGELPYASFGLRVGAAVIDFFILQFAMMLLNALFLGALLSNLSTTTILVATVGPLLAGSLLAMFYSVWLESSSWQATPGKRLLGLKVVDLEGQRIGFAKASGRNLAKGLSLLTCGMGYLMPLWSPRKQALHDKATGCLVIRVQR